MKLIKEKIPLLFKFNDVNFEISNAKFDFSEMEVSNFYPEENKLVLELIKKPSVKLYSWANVEYLKLIFDKVSVQTETTTIPYSSYKGMEVDLLDTGKFEKEDSFYDINEKGQANFTIIFKKQNSDICYFNFFSSDITIEYKI